MRNKIVLFSVIVCLLAVTIFLDFLYSNSLLEKTAYTLAAVGIIYFIFEIALEKVILKQIKISSTKYSLKKTLSILSFVIYALAFLMIWFAETQNILLSIGLIGAAIAFGLQDIFKNFAGGIMIFLNGVYHVGDRIELNKKFGDVIDIGLLYTTLMETREWVSGDQATGRLIIIPNGEVLTGVVQNYTRDFDFIWDEMTIPITYDSDWMEANVKILDIVNTETKEIVEKAERLMVGLEGKYYFKKRAIKPSIFLSLTDNWISFAVRYLAEVRDRRVMHDRLTRIILGELNKSEKIRIASATINIKAFPTIQMKKEQDD